MSGECLDLFAADPPLPPDKPLISVELWITVGLLAFVLLIGAVILYLTDIWRKRQLAPDRDATESLTSFRAMYDRGEISEDEYKQIRARIAVRVKQEVSAANPSLASGAVSASPADSPNLDDPPGEATGPPKVPPTG